MSEKVLMHYRTNAVRTRQAVEVDKSHTYYTAALEIAKKEYYQRRSSAYITSQKIEVKLWRADQFENTAVEFTVNLKLTFSIEDKDL